MIVTVTCNPALDYVAEVPGLTLGVTNRAKETVLRPGGKGLNVSRMLRTFGAETLALGLSAGETGAMLERMVAGEEIPAEWIPLASGSTRINIKLTGGEETEINAPGAPVSEAALAALAARLERLRAGDILCLCGSPAPSMGEEGYARLLAAAKPGVRCVVDSHGETVRRTLPLHPFLIKPNRAELEELTGQSAATPAAAVTAADTLRQQGAENVLCSLGGDGACLVTVTGAWYQPAPVGELRCSVGAGDGMIAGFLAAVLAGEALPEALQAAVAAGSAVAFAGGPVTAAQVSAMRRQLSPLQRIR